MVYRPRQILGGNEAVKTIKRDRKQKIEWTWKQASKLEGCEASRAWNRLCKELFSLSSPESRPPRFNALLRAVWTAATNEQS
jgi:hypothetical protein